MQYNIVVSTSDAAGVDTVGLTATISYVLTDQLKRIPGIIDVSITEITSVAPEEEPIEEAPQEDPAIPPVDEIPIGDELSPLFEATQLELEAGSDATQ